MVIKLLILSNQFEKKFKLSFLGGTVKKFKPKFWTFPDLRFCKKNFLPPHPKKTLLLPALVTAVVYF